MDQSTLMKVRNSLQNLVSYIFALNGLQLAPPQSLRQIGFYVFKQSIDMLAEFGVVVVRAVVGFLCVVSDMMIFIDALDKIRPGSVALAGLGDVFAVAWDYLVQLDDTWMGQLE